MLNILRTVEPRERYFEESLAHRALDDSASVLLARRASPDAIQMMVLATRPSVRTSVPVFVPVPCIERPPAQPPLAAPVHTVHSLFPGAGVKRAVRFGEFKEQLARQLAHAERLQDAHHLPCCVQLFELSAPQTLADVARKVLGESVDPRQLVLLTEEAARRLRLPPPRRLAQHAASTQQSIDVLPAGSRVLLLRVLHDHTQAIAPEPVPAPPPAPALKLVIPERYLKPWEFRITRAEALYDMQSASHGPLALIARCVRRLTRRREYRRWLALLKGDLEEQLWTVRPPSGGVADPQVRTWAATTLRLAGYDVDRMLCEWELYWRRKGS